MPLARPTLLSLRLKAGIKTGRFARLVEASRNHYSNVEHRRKPGSHELFARCARVLSEKLDQELDANALMSEDEDPSGAGAAAEAETHPAETPARTAEAGAQARRGAA